MAHPVMQSKLGSDQGRKSSVNGVQNAMSDKIGPYDIIELSQGRRVLMNALDLTAPKHYMYGLLEVDVSVPRKFIAEE
jgi:hypothetical protein